MRLDDLCFINFKVKFYRILFYMASLPCYLFVLFLICDDRVFTWEQMMLQVIELLLSEKLDDEIILVEI